jgi:hypothetical protein
MCKKGSTQQLIRIAHAQYVWKQRPNLECKVLEDQGITWKMDIVEMAEFWKIKESLGKWILSWNS